MDAQENAVPPPGESPDIIQRIAQLTRMLRDSMRELGLDQAIKDAAQAIPDARDRLRYVAHMTEQAAHRVLNAAESAQPEQDALQRAARALDERWQQWFETSALELPEARDLVRDTRQFLQEVPGRAQATQAKLLEIIMAQDFQDEIGQQGAIVYDGTAEIRIGMQGKKCIADQPGSCIVALHQQADGIGGHRIGTINGCILKPPQQSVAKTGIAAGQQSLKHPAQLCYSIVCLPHRLRRCVGGDAAHEDAGPCGNFYAQPLRNPEQGRHRMNRQGEKKIIKTERAVLQHGARAVPGLSGDVVLLQR